MLQSFGWSEGKGLGANEDGVTTHIRVAKKQDTLGVGAKKTTSDNWLENSSAFDNLLKNLNQSMGTPETDDAAGSGVTFIMIFITGLGADFPCV